MLLHGIKTALCFFFSLFLYLCSAGSCQGSEVSLGLTRRLRAHNAHGEGHAIDVSLVGREYVHPKGGMCPGPPACT